MIKTATTMMASSTGLSAKPRASLPKLTSGRGQQVDDQLADGRYWGAGRRDYPRRKPGDSEAGQAGDGPREPCPPSGGACRVPLVAPVHLPILRRCSHSDNESGLRIPHVFLELLAVDPPTHAAGTLP